METVAWTFSVEIMVSFVKCDSAIVEFCEKLCM